MRSFSTSIGRRRRMAILGGTLLALLAMSLLLPCSRGELINQGGRIQVHRSRNQPVAPTAPVRTALPPTYFPDNDLAHPSDRREAEPARVLAPAFPWNQPGFVEYREQPLVAWDSPPGPAKKYSVEVTPLPRKVDVAEPTAAMLIVHLPEHARLWVEDTQTRLRGQTRVFRSPLLRPGKKYNYTVRVAWIEDGRWVGQTRIVPVRAGLVQTVYLTPSPAAVEDRKPERKPLPDKNAAKAAQ